MSKVTIYLTNSCYHCRRATRLLDGKGVPYEKVDVTHNPCLRTWLREVTGSGTVPQVFINGKSVGGSDDIHALDARGELDLLLNQTENLDS